MAQLSSLPIEIVDYILGLIPTFDLASLCLVNKFLRQHAEPFLYSTITLEWDYWHLPPMVSLISTLLQRPSLFSYIHSLSMIGAGFGHIPPFPLDTEKLSFDQAISAIEKTQVPYIDQWVDQLRSGSGSGTAQALVGLLIANASKISFLAIAHNFYGYPIINQVLQSKIHGQLPRFERLKQLIYTRQLNPFLPNTDENFLNVIPLFSLQTVTDLVLAMPTPKEFQWPTRELSFSNLTSLELEFGYPRYLIKILSSTYNLKSLSWKWKCDRRPMAVPDSTLDYDQIVEALLPLKNTLERLCFRLYAYYTMACVDPEIDIVGSWNGLSDFRELVYLDVPLISLTGVGLEPQPIEWCIPGGIETLCLTPTLLFYEFVALWMNYPEMDPDLKSCEMAMEDYRDEESIMPVILALVEKCPSVLPRLRRIIFLSLNDEEQWPSTMGPLLKQLSGEHGIKLELLGQLSWVQRHLPATGRIARIGDTSLSWKSFIP